jgi:hypothetical protein
MYSMSIPPTSGTLAGATSGGQPEATQTRNAGSTVMRAGRIPVASAAGVRRLRRATNTLEGKAFGARLCCAYLLGGVSREALVR